MSAPQQYLGIFIEYFVKPTMPNMYIMKQCAYFNVHIIAYAYFIECVYLRQ